MSTKYILTDKKGKQIFKGSLDLALAIDRAFRTKGIDTALGFDVPTAADKTEDKIRFLGEI